MWTNQVGYIEGAGEGVLQAQVVCEFDGLPRTSLHLVWMHTWAYMSAVLCITPAACAGLQGDTAGKGDSTLQLSSMPFGVVCPAGQHVLERTAVLVSGGGGVEARFTVGLPAQGRSIMGRWAAQIITQHITRWVCGQKAEGGGSWGRWNGRS
jgi:hypothetical protein